MEELVLEEDLLRYLLWAADEERGERSASNCPRVLADQPRSQPMRFIIAA
jgi:hypothetical protein